MTNIPYGFGLVVEACAYTSRERYATPVRDERCLLVPTIHSHPKHPIGARRRGGGRPIAAPDLLNAEAQLVPERLGQRGPHDPLETIEPVAVVGKLVVLHDTPELLLVMGHDAVWRVVFHFRPVYRFTAAHVRFALSPRDGHGHPQTDISVDGAFRVVMHGAYLITEEARGFGPRVSDQSLGLGEFQFERVAQELAEAGLDLLSLRAWPSEAEQKVVGVAHVAQASV